MVVKDEKECHDGILPDLFFLYFFNVIRSQFQWPLWLSLHQLDESRCQAKPHLQPPWNQRISIETKCIDLEAGVRLGRLSYA